VGEEEQQTTGYRINIGWQVMAVTNQPERHGATIYKPLLNRRLLHLTGYCHALIA
jgi:hypothetical protein